jgi:hypothetical protein
MLTHQRHAEEIVTAYRTIASLVRSGMEKKPTKDLQPAGKTGQVSEGLESCIPKGHSIGPTMVQ